MKVETIFKSNCAIVYDGDSITEPEAQWFDPDHWAGLGLLRGSAPGRGAALFLDTPAGAAVLRRFARGGWAAHLSKDRYIFTGFGRSRPFREFRLLASMEQQGLPVPHPLAAICCRHGLLSQGALLTRRIPDVSSLADYLPDGPDDLVWRAIGACIARFHRAGIRHPDLNARNILLQDRGRQIYLLDFDRGQEGRPGAVDGRPNLARLRRSLTKLWPPSGSSVLEERWASLLEGYHG